MDLLRPKVPQIVKLLENDNVKPPLVLRVRSESALEQTETHQTLEAAVLQYLFCEHLGTFPYLLDQEGGVVYDSKNS